jgi:ABC-type transport system involved in multi-copper enzyme maturation permease subunit
MSIKAVQDQKDDAPLSAGWQPPPETAPSLVRAAEPTFARVIGFTGLLLMTIGAAALLASFLGWNSRVGPGWGLVLFITGVCGLLFHASGEKDLQYRRAYGSFGFAWVLAGFIFTLVPVNDQVGALFLPYGLGSFALGLFFLLPFARNEDDVMWNFATVRVIGGVGGLLALIGLIGGNVSPTFLIAKGLPMAFLGLLYLWAYVGLVGAESDRGYWTGVGLGAVGLLVFLIAVGRSLLAGTAASYFVPTGLFLMGLGLLYLLAAAGICVDSKLVVMTRRELSAFFFSPIAYIVFLGVALLGWYQFLHFSTLVWLASEPESPLTMRSPVQLFEPVTYYYLYNFLILVEVIFIIPVLTMRLLSEEKRTGTLEVLMTAPLKESQVVLGKFFAAFLVYMLAWASWALFLVALRVEGGKEFDYRPLLTFYIALACTGAGFISMGLFFSSLTRNQVTAAILTFLGMLVLTSFYLIQLIFQDTLPEGSTLKAALNYVSYVDLWIMSWSGTLAPRYLIFHVSAAVFWLFLTMKVLEARKWS